MSKAGPVHAAEELLTRLLADLGLEERVARDRVDALTRDAAPKALEERGVLLRKGRVVEARPGMLGRVRVVVGEDNNRAGHVDRFDVRPGGTVHLLERGEDGGATVVGHAVVTRRRRGELHLMFDGGDAASDLDNGDVVDLVVGFDEVTLRRLKDGVGRARRSSGRHARLVEHLLGFVPPRPTKLTRIDGAVDVDTLGALKLSASLNDDQRRAAAHALLAEDVALVHGPPGTGKTKVLVDVVVAAVARGERVLCLTASNAAVDHLAISILNAAPSTPLARFGDPARANEALEAHTLYALTREHPHRVLAKDLLDQAHKLLRGARRRSDTDREAWARQRDARHESGRLFAEARELERTAAVDVLQKTRVLCGTLTGRLDELVDPEHPFSLLVVDEASQALTPALLLPLSLLSSEGRVVLAGDHKQLP
ncbi:MAG TPA: AAA domain-containing protein, partial [Myxococcota bacterium]